MMNWKIIISVLLLGGFVWTGCNKAKELLDVEFDADFKVDLPVSMSDSRTTTFLVEETFDPLNDKEVKKYSQKIKAWRVNELSGIFLQVNPDFELNNGLIKVSSVNHEAAWTIDDQTIIEGTTILLGNENGQWETLTQLLDEPEMITAHFSGSSSGEEDFVLQIVIKTRVTANPL